MTGEEIAALAARLDAALAHESLEAVVAQRAGGNTIGHHPISGVQIIGHLLARGVVLRDTRPTWIRERAPLRLVED